MVQPTPMKDQILSVATDLFAAKGFKGTSIRDISNALGISISNLYHYFGSKEGLLLAILQRTSETLLDDLQRVSEMELEPLERFKRLIETHLRQCRDFGKETRIFMLDKEHLSREGDRANRQIQRRVLAIYLKELGTLANRGLVTSRNLKVLAFNVLGVINWYLRWYRPDGPLSHDEVTEEITAFILNGIRGADI
ncbi:MAG: TetR/AcrR family transcriptional regulator [Desulfobacterales bacterium]|nr:MAG: TetR/AcrR family transcriptional regulator [Desulfobacterales bacterium]